MMIRNRVWTKFKVNICFYPSVTKETVNPIPYGGGHMAPPAENRPLSVEKMRIFKNERSEKALPTPHNPT